MVEIISTPEPTSSDVRLYREDEVIEYITSYLICKKRQEKFRDQERKSKKILARQRKRAFLRQKLQDAAIAVSCIVLPAALYKMSGVNEVNILYLVAVPMAWATLKGGMR